MIVKYPLKKVVIGCIDVFSEVAGKGIKKIQEAGNIIEDAVTKTRTIEKKLNKVQDLPVVEAEKLVLEAPDEETFLV